MFNTNNKSNAINTNTKRTPFCKVCIDAGLPKSVYESHWVKTQEGKVCCPTLLDQSCRYCKLKGHTVKFCSLLIKQEETKQLQLINKKPNIIIKLQEPEVNNVFSTLYESDTDDETSKKKSKQLTTVKVVIPSPKPVITSNTQSPPNNKTYASVVTSKPNHNTDEETSFQINMLKQEELRVIMSIKNIKIIKNWADYSDSDSD